MFQTFVELSALDRFIEKTWNIVYPDNSQMITFDVKNLLSIDI